MNLRHVLRVNARMILEIFEAGRRAADGDFEQCLIFATISAANNGHVDDDPLLAQAFAGKTVPDDMRRPIRMLRISESLGLARETTRVKVGHLVRKGLVTRTPGGLFIPAGVTTGGQLDAMFDAYIRSVAKAVDCLAAAGAAGLARDERLGGNIEDWRWGVVRNVAHHALRGVADLIHYVQPDNLIEAYLFLAVLDHAGAHLSAPGRVLYPDHLDYPPLAERRTITASGLASVMGIPRETVRRNLIALVNKGLIYKSPEGFGLPIIDSEAGRRADRVVQMSSMADMVRLVRRLRDIGAIARIA
jgi:hypothetical protein